MTQPRIFISHNSADNTLGYRLVGDLRAMYGEDAVWYDSRGGILPGDVWPERLQLELTERDTFLVLLSPDSVASRWVRDEINMAWQQHNSARGKVIIPVLVRPCAVPPYLATIQYVSFLPDDPTHPYELAFAELLDAIRLATTRFHETERMPLIPQGPPDDTLPAPEHFVGRVADLNWVLQRLRQGGGVTAITALNGMGGIGKTALAAEALRQVRQGEALFPAGIAVVGCEGQTDPTAVLSQVLSRFDPQRRLPDTSEPADLALLGGQLLQGRRALVVLDNVEPVLAETLAVITDALRAAGATLLVTARELLPASVVRPEGRLSLPLLSSTEALDVFAIAYGRSGSGGPAAFTPIERQAAEHIVHILDRHTLAVKLAGAYAADVARPLDRLADELAQDPLDLPQEEAPRQVARVLGRSYSALPAAARRLFDALRVFASPEFGRQAAVTLAKGIGVDDPKQAVEVLVRRALLEATVNDALPAEADRERLRLHPLLRAYATDRRHRSAPADDGTDDTDGARDADGMAADTEAYARVAEWYADYTNAVPDLALTPDEANIIGALEWLRTWRTNTLEAHDTHQARSQQPAADPDQQDLDAADRLSARICVGMRHFWRNTGRTGTGLAYLVQGMAAAERVATRSSAQTDRLRVTQIAAVYAELLQRSGRIDAAEQLFRRNLDLHREMGDRRGESYALHNLGQVAYDRGELVEAQRYYEQALAIDREVQHRRGEGVMLAWLGRVAQDRGRLAEAQAYYEQSLAIHREVQNRREEGVTLNNLGHVAQQRGELADAQRYYEQALAIFREVQFRHGEGAALASLGGMAQDRGRLAEAQAYYEQALAIVREVQDRRNEGATLNNLGSVARDRGELAEAQAYYEQSLAIHREVQNRAGESNVLTALGRLVAAQERWAAAEDAYRQALALDTALDNRRGVLIDLRDLATTLEAQDRTAEANAVHLQAQDLAHLLVADDTAETAAATDTQDTRDNNATASAS